MRNSRLPKQCIRHRKHGEGYDKEADAAMRERRTCECLRLPIGS
jgi:hypothetical protein